MSRTAFIAGFVLLLLSCEQPMKNTVSSEKGHDSEAAHSDFPGAIEDSPPLLNSPIDDGPAVFMNTYYGAVGASPPTPQNPDGIHQGIDFVAPAGTPVKAVTAGNISRITTQIKTEPDGTLNTYAEVFLDIGDHNSFIYIFEPLQQLSVSESQSVDAGDTLGTLADNRGQNMRGTQGTGTLDLGLMSLVNGNYRRVCFVPYAGNSFKTLMETWFSRVYTATPEHPGPCVCHYQFPSSSVPYK
jgi:hypothetical protein